MLNFTALLHTLPIMFYGLAGIFTVILLIAAVVKLLLLLFPPKGTEN